MGPQPGQESTPLEALERRYAEGLVSACRQAGVPRIIYLGGRPHPAEVNPTWYGDSIAKWDGDTLVVDTVGFNDRTWLDSVGHPHTEQLHVTERYRRPNLDNLQLEVTIEDPGAYAKPFTLAGSFRLAADKELRERYCYTSPVDK